MAAPLREIKVTADTTGFARTARTIAKHMTALADELEAPDAIIAMGGELTAEQADEFRERFKSAYATGYGQGRDDEANGVETETGGER